MARLVLDSGGVTWLAERSPDALAFVKAFRRTGIGPPVVATAVLIECLTGDGARDATAHRLINTCDVVEELSRTTARQAAALRTARRGSAVDALVVALAEPGGTVLTGDPDDLRPLAASAIDVTIRAI